MGVLCSKLVFDKKCENEIVRSISNLSFVKFTEEDEVCFFLLTKFVFAMIPNEAFAG